MGVDVDGVPVAEGVLSKATQLERYFARPRNSTIDNFDAMKYCEYFAK
jgi:hypothetical protein